MKSHLYRILFAALLILTACSYDFPEKEGDDDDFGTASFERFYVMGGTFSSGYMDGALYKEGQQSSYPAIIGQKINSYYNSNLYNQPVLDNERGFNLFESPADNIVGKFTLKFRAKDDEFPGRFATEGEWPAAWNGDHALLNDFSIPGLTIMGLIDSEYPEGNPYFMRLPMEAGNTILDAVAGNSPEIVLLSLGVDDLLPWAIHGMDIQGNNTFSGHEILSAEDFDKALDEILNRLLAETNAEIFLTTIYDFTDAPYFTALPYYFDLGREVTAGDVAGFASHYQEFNSKVFEYNFGGGGIPQDQRRPFIDFDVNGGDSFRAKVIYDESLPDAVLPDGTVIPKIRQMLFDEYLLYSAEPVALESTSFGSFEPISNRFVLRADQIEFFRDRITRFNMSISKAAEDFDHVHLVDIHQTLKRVSEGMVIVEGVTFNSLFARNSIYSADGYSLNPAGNAMVANRVIEELNKVLNTKILPVNVNNYKSLGFENQF